MPEPVVPNHGWGVLHLFVHVSPATDSTALRTAISALESLEDHQVVPVAILGHKADLGFMAIGPDMWQLREFQRAIVAAGTTLAWSYLSLTELSEYSDELPERMKEMRLRPQLPPKNKPAWCFYPMGRKRDGEQNWFTEDFDRRKAMMMEHGKSGRTFAGRILQVVTGSTGLDDYEWGVTLFAEAMDDLKEVVYTMRYDEASAVYSEFGPFYTGIVGTLDEVLESVTGAGA